VPGQFNYSNEYQFRMLPNSSQEEKILKIFWNRGLLDCHLLKENMANEKNICKSDSHISG